MPTTASTPCRSSSPSTAWPTCGARTRTSAPSLIIERCAHPDFRDSLRRYFDMAKGGHTPQTLSTVFRMHEQFLKQGDMRGVDWTA